MNPEQIRQLYDRELRREVAYPDTQRDVTPMVVRHIYEVGRKVGWVLWSRLDATTVDAAIEEQIAYFDSRGVGFEWKHYDYDTPADLKERLIQRGFEARTPADAIMVLDLQARPDVLHHTPHASIRRLQHPDEVAGIVDLLEDVWQEDFAALGTDLAHQMAHHPQHISIYAAVMDDMVVSGAWTQFVPDSQFASLWGGSTRLNYRQRGLYTGLLAARAAEAIERGVNFLTVDASPMSRPILEKLGFTCIAISTACMWKSKAE